MPISIGCAVWSYPGWVGEVYPPKTPAKDYLRVYSNRFPAVEGNTTFYAIPDRATIDRWIAQTPAGFQTRDQAAASTAACTQQCEQQR